MLLTGNLMRHRFLRSLCITRYPIRLLARARREKFASWGERGLPGSRGVEPPEAKHGADRHAMGQ